MSKSLQPRQSQLGLLMPLIGHLTCHVRQQASEIYKALGYELTPEAADALMIIHHFDGLPQKKLADILGKDRASITRLLNTLVNSHLVERVQDKEDRRIIRAHITDEGKKAFEKLTPKLLELSNSILNPVAKDDFDRMLGTLSTIIDNLPCQTTKNS